MKYRIFCCSWQLCLLSPSAPYVLFGFENYCTRSYEEERGRAFSALLVNEVTLVSADVHVRRVQKQGLWLIALLWLWQRAQHAAGVCLGKGKTDGGREALGKRAHNRKF